MEEVQVVDTVVNSGNVAAPQQNGWGVAGVLCLGIRRDIFLYRAPE